MLTAPAAVDITFDDDSWGVPPVKLAYNRAVSVGNSWGVTSIGRGFNWAAEEEEESNELGLSNAQGDSKLPDSSLNTESFVTQRSPGYTFATPASSGTLYPTTILTPSALPIQTKTSRITSDPFTLSPTQSPSLLSRPLTPSSSSLHISHINAPPRPVRSPTSPRPRRRSSQQRVSLIAGRLSIAPIEPPSPPPVAPQKLIRSGSTASLLSLDTSTRPPTPSASIITQTSSERSISEFVIQGEIGRGAYGLVKKAREMKADGRLGPPLVIKQVIKSRILADCWKKHPKYGTIPIEIYVMSAISNTSYILPPRRPWDPSRRDVAEPPPCQPEVGGGFEWVEGKVVKGHPNICPLLDFFEDNHYYYLVLPSTIPEPAPNAPIPPSDLFDLVESYPNGLPPSSVRAYLGQIADAMSFLHSKGIVHRDIKDENVILGPRNRCILIDFGSSGLVRKGGWDTFSGTLDYAGPEILRGERYQGPEQDVWAFGVVAYVMLVGECPFTTAAEAQEGLVSPLSNTSIALDERCLEGHETEGEEPDGGGALVDAAALVRACLQLDVSARPTFDKILESRFLSGRGGWGIEDP